MVEVLAGIGGAGPSVRLCARIPGGVHIWVWLAAFQALVDVPALWICAAVVIIVSAHRRLTTAKTRSSRRPTMPRMGSGYLGTG